MMVATGMTFIVFKKALAFGVEASVGLRIATLVLVFTVAGLRISATPLWRF